MNLKKIFDSVELYERAAEKAKSLGQNQRSERFGNYAEQKRKDNEAAKVQRIVNLFGEEYATVFEKAIKRINEVFKKNGLGTFEFSDLVDGDSWSPSIVIDKSSGLTARILPGPACVHDILEGNTGRIDEAREDGYLVDNDTRVEGLECMLEIRENNELIECFFMGVDPFEVYDVDAYRTSNPRVARICATLQNDFCGENWKKLGIPMTTKADFIA